VESQQNNIWTTAGYTSRITPRVAAAADIVAWKGTVGCCSRESIIEAKALEEN